MEEIEQQDCSVKEIILMFVMFAMCICIGIFIFMAGTWYSQAHEKQAESKIISPLPESK